MRPHILTSPDRHGSNTDCVLALRVPLHPSHPHQKVAGLCCTGVWRQPANLLCALAVLASMTVSTTQHLESSVPLLSCLDHTVRSAFPSQCCPSSAVIEELHDLIAKWPSLASYVRRVPCFRLRLSTSRLQYNHRPPVTSRS